jgi:hypothetical protein
MILRLFAVGRQILFSPPGVRQPTDLAISNMPQADVQRRHTATSGYAPGKPAAYMKRLCGNYITGFDRHD